VPMRAHHPFPLAELLSLLAADALNLGSDNSGSDSTDDALGELILNGENVLDRAVVTLRPDVVAVARIDQLRRDAHTIPGLAHAAFENVAYAELTSDLTHIDRFTFVSEGRVAGDDEQPMCL